MKQMIFISSIISLAVALCGCGGSDDPDPVPSVNISVQPESVAFPAEGGNRQIEVNTTGKEWGAYANADWIKV